MRIGSLFAGIGGLELGLERAGLGPVIWQVEQDEYCRRILARHWPDAARYDDVRTVGASSLEPVDLICGGFPCQDLSFAGKGAGLAGARSGLWSEFARIVRELRPRYVVVENVPALLARGLGVVLGDLAACGYDATWDCIPAAAVGAPHLRYRLFVVAYPQGLRCAGNLSKEPGPACWQHPSPAAFGRHLGPQGSHAPDPLREQLRQQPDEQSWSHHALQPRVDGAAEPVADADGNEAGGLPGGAAPADTMPSGASWWRAEPDVDRVADGVPARVDRLRALGNAVVPQVAEVVGRVVLQIEAELSR